MVNISGWPHQNLKVKLITRTMTSFAVWYVMFALSVIITCSYHCFLLKIVLCYVIAFILDHSYH